MAAESTNQSILHKVGFKIESNPPDKGAPATKARPINAVGPERGRSAHAVWRR